MSIRGLLETKKRRLMVMAFVGLSFALVGVLLAQNNVINFQPARAVLPGVIIFMLALAYGHLFAFRCLECRKNLGPLVMESGSNFLRIDSAIRFCPFCGVDIDGEAGLGQVLEGKADG